MQNEMNACRTRAERNGLGGSVDLGKGLFKFPNSLAHSDPAAVDDIEQRSFFVCSQNRLRYSDHGFYPCWSHSNRRQRSHLLLPIDFLGFAEVFRSPNIQPSA